MAEILDINKNTPPVPARDTDVRPDEASELAHRRMEHDAMESAKKAGERMKRNEAGRDIISNM